LHVWKDAAHVRQASFEFIEVYYNRKRIQKELGYLTPAEYELRFDNVMAQAA
jgi:putative transposase